jgi:drug/metabolite transporter (DMT)-like permease
MNIIDLWVVFAILSVICKTWFYTLQKKYLDDNVNPYTTAYISSLYGAIVTIPFALWDIIYNDVSVSLNLVFILILFGIAESIYFLVYLFALNNLNASIASPLKKSKPVFIGLFEPIILTANISLSLLLSALLTTLGGVLTVLGSNDSLNSYKNDLTKIGLIFAILSLFMGVTMSLISRYGASNISPFVFGAGVTIVMTITTRILLYRSEVKNMSIKVNSKKGIMLGLLGAFRSVFVWLAYSLVVATAVSTLTQSTLIIDIILAKYYLKEDISRTQWAGIFIIFIGSIIAILVV